MKNQPFLYNNGLLFCKLDSHSCLTYGSSEFNFPFWKIWKRNLEGVESEVITPTSGEHGGILCECNPYVFHINSDLYLGYVAGFWNGQNSPVIYYGVHCQIDENLNIIGPLIVGERAFSSFILNGNVFYSRKTENGDVIFLNDSVFELGITFSGIYRLIPIFNNSEFFLVTGTVNQSNVDKSFLVKISDGTFSEVKNLANESIYKCSIFGNDLVYTVKGAGEGGTERSLSFETLNQPLF